MQNKVWFEVLGNPVAKARPRLGKYGRTYTPKKTQDYENLVRTAYLLMYDKNVSKNAFKCNIECIFEIPKSYSKKKRKYILEEDNSYNHKPDLDNLAKAVLDSLNGIAYEDDSQCVELEVSKKYGNDPKVIVQVEFVGDKDGIIN